jgi:hypothetical protein
MAIEGSLSCGSIEDGVQFQLQVDNQSRSKSLPNGVLSRRPFEAHSRKTATDLIDRTPAMHSKLSRHGRQYCAVLGWGSIEFDESLDTTIWTALSRGSYSIQLFNLEPKLLIEM